MGIFGKLFKKKETIRKREGNPDVYDLPNEDERMNWGMEKARLTLHYFEDCLSNPKDGQHYFSIKARVEDGNKVEHIWLTETSFDEDGTIYGIISNKPIDVTTVSINEKIGIKKEYVSDWMIIENGRLIGGYTIRAIRVGLKGKELENFDKNLGGILVDEGEDYFLSNFETPEGAILSIEDAYDNKDLEKAINCKNFKKEAELMLKSTVKIDIDNELIEKTAEVLKLSFIKSIQENGFPSFKGVKRVFNRNFISPEHCVITEICIYPNGNKSSQKLNTYKTDNNWKVLNPVE
ncbi:MAG TPA: DUF2314 domain-containing protein [Flavobacteriia bacterium]|nr:DUF2314 domain-containing protein [Flavobacteriia bacterium]